jgi:DNA-binding MarR family transcriptional regulator
MKLTPEQRTDVERQRRENPRARGVRVALTPEQRAERLRHLADVEAGHADDVAYWRNIEAAAVEPGFSGDLRRAMLDSGQTSDELATQLGVDAELIDQFRTGQDVLPYDVVTRLVEALGFRLTAEAAAP